MKVKILLQCFLALSTLASAIAQHKRVVPDYKNAKLSTEIRVRDLLARMTLEEKVGQLQTSMKEHQVGDMYKNGIGNIASVFGKYDPKTAALKQNQMQLDYKKNTRLGIPVIHHGEAVFGLMAYGMTSFPQPIMQASTFDPKLQARMVKAIAAETYSRGFKQVLSPTINVAYDSRWGRTHETYGEDPFLVSRMGVAYINTMQSAGVICTPKHFAANIGHNGLFGGAISYNERFLREVEFPPFKAAIMDAKARSIMPAYNTIDGVPCIINNWLLQDVLRKEWKFTGFISSDYGALREVFTRHRIADNKVDIATMGLKAGMDVEMPFPDVYEAPLIEAVKSGKLPIAYVDSAVSRVLHEKFRLGLFENATVDAELAAKICDNAVHRALAREVAQKGVVLLKNENKMLPFSKNIKSIAVLGPLADNLLLGNYAGWGMKKVSILEGIKNKIGNTAKVNFEKGVELTQLSLPIISKEWLYIPNDPAKRHGVKAEYFNNTELKGKPALIRIDATIDFEWGDAVPDPFIFADNYSVRWQTELLAPATGKFKIGMSIDDGARLFINDKLVLEDWKGGAVRLLETDVEFQKGERYQIRMEYFESLFGATARLGWNAEPNANIPKAIDFAMNSDATVIVVGALDGEGKDRPILDLSTSQEELINAIAKTGKPFAVILASGNVITMQNWIENTPAILEAWYSGEEGGNAVADVLFGDYNPGGKLPITFPKNVGQMPCYYFQKPDVQSSYIGIGNEPQFSFGHGLSYTTFKYSNIKLSSSRATANDKITLSVEVTNTGQIKGDEVVQLYIKDQFSSVATPAKQLKGFERISLEAGETKNVTFTITKEELSLYNTDMQWVVEYGKFDLMVGGASNNIKQTAVLEIY